MNKFTVSWTEEVWQNVVIEADSKEEAVNKFWENDYDFSSTKITGGEIQDGVDVFDTRSFMTVEG